MTRNGSLRGIVVESPDDQARFCAVPNGDPLDPVALMASGADEHWLVWNDDGAGGPLARFSLWWRNAPTYAEHRAGLIGHYAAPDPLGAPLLRFACERLRLIGCTLAIGPMDGDTYHRYRLVTERGAEPPFFLEPANPDGWPAHFSGSGFTPLAHYYSALQENLDAADPRIPEIERRMAAAGVRVRSLDPADFARELRRVYPVVAASFAGSLLASPISEDTFVAQYRPLEPLLKPELTQIAETGERAVGFLLVVPDWLQARRGETIDTAVVKTMAVLPEYQRQGLGMLLGARAQQAARALGYTRAIHALIREDNVSRRLSDAYHGRVIRRYTLYMQELEGAQ